MENKLLSVLIYDRPSYRNIIETINITDFSDIGQLILEEITNYYNLDDSAQTVDKDILISSLSRKYPEQEGLFSTIINDLHDVSVPNVLAEYLELRIQSLGRRIAALLQSGSRTNELNELIAEYTYLQEKGEAALLGDEDPDVSIGIDFDELFTEIDPENLIHVYPRSLNDRLDGGVPRGSHIVVFARPEAGKSMFVINMTAGFLRHGHTVLYIGNEDPAAVMKQRISSSLTSRTKIEMLANQDAVEEEAIGLGSDKLIFFNAHPGTIADIRRLVHKYKPDVFIVDQMRNINSSKALTKVEHLEYIAQSIRNLAKETNSLGVSVTQAGDSGDSKLILELCDVDFSNTGIPSTADVMIGIGMNSEYDRMGRRVLSLPKNKVSGIHESFPIRVFPNLSKCEDV